MDSSHPESQAHALCLRGDVLRQQGQFKDALTYYGRALDIDTNCVLALVNRGGIFRLLQRSPEAEAEYRKALKIDPSHVEAHYNLGNLLLEGGRLAEAESCFRSVIQLRPLLDRAHRNLGRVLAETGRIEEAVARYQEALILNPNFVGALVDLGHVFRLLGRASDAVHACHKALALAGDNAIAHLNLGLALQDEGNIDEAIIRFRRALSINPNYAMAELSEGLAHLLRGDFVAGLQKYEARWRTKDLIPRHFSQPQWDGESLADKCILLHAEQGLGDSLQFLRYAPLVAQRAERVVLELQPSVIPLAASLRGVELIARGQPLPRFDFHCPLLSLPRAFGTTLETIPAVVPYLSAPPISILKWRNKLIKDHAFRIGVAWAGNSKHRADYSRSMAISTLAPLISNDARIKWYSLQVEAPSAERTTMNSLPIIDLSSKLIDFGETAAVIANLDLVISVDTAVAHTAGALGKTVWLMLPCSPDWRWLQHRSDSPWYPSMRLFRQNTPGRWDHVVNVIKLALEGHLATEARNT